MRSQSTLISLNVCSDDPIWIVNCSYVLFSPQSVILKQRRDAELKAAAEKLAADIVAANKTKRAEMVKRSEMYEKEYAQVICD